MVMIFFRFWTIVTISIAPDAICGGFVNTSDDTNGIDKFFGTDRNLTS
jgi:hypothetical protein